MDRRYEHPQVAALWSLPWTYDAWWRIEKAVLTAQHELGLLGDNGRIESSPVFESTIQPVFDQPTAEAILSSESTTKHDVASFLAYLRDWWGEPAGRWIHFGLTSSDIVDTAQGMRFKAVKPILHQLVDGLHRAVAAWEKNDTPLLGRTHGQPAEPTAMRVRAAHWSQMMINATMDLCFATQDVMVAKIAGPVGTYSSVPPDVEFVVAEVLGLRPQGHGASQIAPRLPLSRWADAAARLVRVCAKIAMDVRLMNLVGEVRWVKTPGQVGSSSMAHKNNPVVAEQIGGMARLAAGYAAMLQPLDIWLERDISHSSVERVAVPDLWHVVLHAMSQTTTMLNTMELSVVRAGMNIDDACNDAWVHHNTLEEIRGGMTAEAAREFALDVDMCGSYAEASDFMRNYPRPK